jgi:hypothetical protein
MKRPAVLVPPFRAADERITAGGSLMATAPSSPVDRAVALRVARAVGALALLVTGGVHYEQYKVAHFSVIPTIGPLFLLNFIAATTVGLVLLVPVRATVGPRRLIFDSLAALAGIGIASGAFVGLLITEHTPLFGFMEHGYRLEIVIALVAEAVAITSLGVFLACARWRVRRLRKTAGIAGDAIRATPAPRASEA